MTDRNFQQCADAIFEGSSLIMGAIFEMRGKFPPEMTEAQISEFNELSLRFINLHRLARDLGNSEKGDGDPLVVMSGGT